MTLKRYATRRDGNEGAIVDAIEAHGMQVLRIDQPCDLLVGYGGVNYLLEVKSCPKAPLTPIQEQMRDHWPGQFEVVRSPDEALAWCQRVKVKSVPFRGTIS